MFNENFKYQVNHEDHIGHMVENCYQDSVISSNNDLMLGQAH